MRCCSKRVRAVRGCGSTCAGSGPGAGAGCGASLAARRAAALLLGAAPLVVTQQLPDAAPLEALKFRDLRVAPGQRDQNLKWALRGHAASRTLASPTKPCWLSPAARSAQAWLPVAGAPALGCSVAHIMEAAAGLAEARAHAVDQHVGLVAVVDAAAGKGVTGWTCACGPSRRQPGMRVAAPGRPPDPEPRTAARQHEVQTRSAAAGARHSQQHKGQSVHD